MMVLESEKEVFLFFLLINGKESVRDLPRVVAIKVFPAFSATRLMRAHRTVPSLRILWTQAIVWSPKIPVFESWLWKSLNLKLHVGFQFSKETPSCWALCAFTGMHPRTQPQHEPLGLIHFTLPWFIIAFITWNSNLVPLLEGLCRSNSCRFEFPFFLGVCRNRTDDLSKNSPTLWPSELVLHCLG